MGSSVTNGISAERDHDHSEQATLQFLLWRDAGWIRARALVARQALERIELGPLSVTQIDDAATAMDAIDEILALAQR